MHSPPAQVGYDPVYGARPVKRAIQHSLETLLAQAILRGDVEDEDQVTVDVAPEQGPARLQLTVKPAGNGAPRAKQEAAKTA